MGVFEKIVESYSIPAWKLKTESKPPLHTDAAESDVIEETFSQTSHNNYEVANLDDNKKLLYLNELRQLQETLKTHTNEYGLDYYLDYCGYLSSDVIYGIHVNKKEKDEKELLDMLQKALDKRREKLTIQERISFLKKELQIE